MKVLKKIKMLLEKNSFYLRFRYRSFLYKLWLLVRVDVRKTYKAKEQFYKQIIPTNCSLIYDIGANEGMLTNIFSRLTKRVVAIEPSARNMAILRAKFDNNSKIELVPVAVSDNNGKMPWFEDNSDFAMGTLSSKWNSLKSNESEITAKAFVQTIMLDDLIMQYGKPSYIKIDVEGSELAVLKGLSEKIPLLSFEAILPYFLEETIQCIEQVCNIESLASFNFCMDDVYFYEVFTDRKTFINDIKNLTTTIDIFCKM